jgi:hypothetical protein
MKTRTLPAFLVLSAIAAFAGPAARGEDAEDPMTRDAKSKIEYFDKNAGHAKDDGKFADLLMDLTSLPHALTVERVGRVLTKDRDEEHQAIAASALSEFKKPDAIRDAAGKVLANAITGADIGDDVKDTCIDSIGKLRYKEGVVALNKVAVEGGDPYVLLTTVRVMGELKDRRALTALLMLWERLPKGYKWDTGGEVKVDTGASGTADADAAKAQWESKNKGKGKKGKPPVMFRQYIQELVKTVHILTGDDTIDSADSLRAWMEARAAELAKEGVEIPKAQGGSSKSDKEKGKDKDKQGDGRDKGGDAKK